MSRNYGLWKDPNEEGKKRKARRMAKAALDRFNNRKSVVQFARDAGEKGEALARLAGKGIGFMVGGAAGAGIGDFLAGGIYDKFDDRAETKLEMENYSFDGGEDYSRGSDILNVNRQLDRANKKSNTRHLTSPIKSYLSALALAEIGGAKDMGLIDKSTYSGIDMLKNSSWGQKMAAAKAAKAAKAAESLNILDIVSSGKGGAKAAEKTLLKGGFTKGAGLDIGGTAALAPQYAPSRITTKLGRETHPLGENVVDVPAEKAITADKLETEKAMELFNKKREAARNSMHHYSRIIEGDPGKRAALVEKYSLPELKAMAEGNIDPATGNARHTFIDDLLGGLKKDPKLSVAENNKRIANTIFDPDSKLSKVNTEFQTQSIPVKGSENAHTSIENLQNFLDDGGFNIDSTITEDNMPNIGPRLKIDENLQNMENIRMNQANYTDTRVMANREIDQFNRWKNKQPIETENMADLSIRRDGYTPNLAKPKEPYVPVGQDKIDSFIPNPIDRSGRIQEQPKVDIRDRVDQVVYRGDASWDEAPIEESVNFKDDVFPNLGYPDPKVTAYGKQDIMIYYNDLINSGKTHEEASKIIADWGNEWRFGQITDRTKRTFGSGHYGERVGKPDSNKYKDIVSVIGDDYNNTDFDTLGNRINPLDYGEDWIYPDSSFTPTINEQGLINEGGEAASQFDNFDANAFNPHYSPGADSRALEEMTQGKANDLLESVLDLSYDTSKIDSVVELETLYTHGQMEGWTKEKLVEVRKLIREAKKLKGE